MVLLYCTMGHSCAILIKMNLFIFLLYMKFRYVVLEVYSTIKAITCSSESFISPTWGLKRYCRCLVNYELQNNEPFLMRIQFLYNESSVLNKVLPFSMGETQIQKNKEDTFSTRSTLGGNKVLSCMSDFSLLLRKSCNVHLDCSEVDHSPRWGNMCARPFNVI